MRPGLQHPARLEHGVLPDGTLGTATATSTLGTATATATLGTATSISTQAIDKDCSAFYQETGAGRYVPRSIFLDLEPSVMDEVRREVVVVLR